MKDYTKTTIASYDETATDYAKRTDNLHRVEISAAFLSYLKGNSLILDLGCGPGRDAEIFIENGHKVVGVDLSEKIIELARSRVKEVEFNVMDIRKLEFPDNHFDAVWAGGSFLHISRNDLLKSLQGVYRVMKKNGIFYISVKEGTGENFKIDERYNGVEKFWSYFRKEEIENELIEAGFTILETTFERPKDNYATDVWIRVICKK